MCAVRQVAVAVVGFSGGDIEQNNGIGKSCFCSRFVRPAFDDYETVKGSLSSCISEADFLQREVNRCHFLYFAPTTKEQVEFHVVEQTTLIEDTTLRPFSEAAKYSDRATRLSLRSDGKVAFTSRDHIGISTASDTKWFPSELFEKVGIKGFICVFDPTLDERAMKDQVTMVCDLITNIQSKKLKIPVVLAVSKSDKIEHAGCVGVTCARDTARQYSIPIVYTSAHENMNVTETFLFLASLILKKSHSHIYSCTADTADYVTAMENHRQKLQALDKNYNQLLATVVKGLYVTWSFFKGRLVGKIEYEDFKYVFGMKQAKVAFKMRLLLAALRTSSKLLKSLTEGTTYTSLKRLTVMRDLLLDHEDIGNVDYSLYKEMNQYRCSRYRSFSTGDEQAIDEILMLLKDMTSPSLDRRDMQSSSPHCTEQLAEHITSHHESGGDTEDSCPTISGQEKSGMSVGGNIPDDEQALLCYPGL